MFPAHLGSDLLVIVLAGILAIALLLGAYKLWDLMTTRIDEQLELQKGNIAVAIVLSGFLIAVAHIIAQVAGRVLGGG